MLNEATLQLPGAANGVDVIVRRRPWTIPADHRATVTVRDLRFAAVHNMKAVHVTATSTDKPRVNSELPTFAGIIIANCLFDGMTQTAGEGRHNDAIKAEGSSQVGIATAMTIMDCTFRRIGAGVMPIHASDGGVGGYDTITLRGLRFSECAHPVHIGGRCPIRKLIVRDCPGIQIIGDGDVSGVVVEVVDSPGAVVFGKTYAGTTPPPPPPDPHVGCNQRIGDLERALAAARAERDALAARIARAAASAQQTVEALR